jgi:hypothetical protein
VKGVARRSRLKLFDILWPFYRSNAVQSFLQRHQSDVIGVLSGFDRVLFRGTLRSISYADGLDRFLGAMALKYKDFATFAQDCSQQLKDHAQSMAQKAGRPFVYLSNSSQSKEDIARGIATRDQRAAD